MKRPLVLLLLAHSATAAFAAGPAKAEQTRTPARAAVQTPAQTVAKASGQTVAKAPAKASGRNSVPRGIARPKGAPVPNPAYTLVVLTGHVTALPRKNEWPVSVARKTRATLWLTLDDHAHDGDRSSAHGLYGMHDAPCRWHLQLGPLVFSSEQNPSRFYLSTQLATEANPLEGYAFQAGYFDTLPGLPTLRSLLITWSLKTHGRGLLPDDALPMRGYPLSAYEALRSFTIHAKSARNGTRQDLQLSVDSLKVFQAVPESL